MRTTGFLAVVCAAILISSCEQHSTAERIPIHVKEHLPGAPVTMGIPFPKGSLLSPDHVRLVDTNGGEVPAQVTEVTTWEPADPGIKWVWLFFFAGEEDSYFVEYGEQVRRKPVEGDRVSVRNNQRVNGGIDVDTGPLRFHISKGGSGFFDSVELDLDGNGFDPDDPVATGITGRGSFMDILGQAGMDTSRAIIDQTFVDRGTGPLHAVIRVEGFYEYERENLPAAPFTTRIHAYAGKSYVRVLHTLTYTGNPDMSAELPGEHAAIATQTDNILSEEARAVDEGVAQPNDRIAAAGLGFRMHLGENRTYRAGYRDGSWWESGERQVYSDDLNSGDNRSLLQTGPDVTGIPPVTYSSPDERITGFSAEISGGNDTFASERAEGWVRIADDRRGITIGIVNFLEEYPKEITVGGDYDHAMAWFWSPSVEPMAFHRATTDPDGGMVGNFATGLAKTTEAVFHFHDTEADETAVNYFLQPPTAHADPTWYGTAGVFGKFQAKSTANPDLERGLEYKFDWVLFNQRWEPWYGMFYYGDTKTNYYNNEWFMWGLNEPAQDFMIWLQFMRTGEPRYLRAARAKSRYIMDVGNIHWPAGYDYRGDTNDALDWWLAKEQPGPTPYLGMGRRHAGQPWISLLSAHVWSQGLIASYYLDGYHRGLDVARLIADYHVRRPFGEHNLRGRRLYLSLYNLHEVWDATKSDVYRKELEYRFERLLTLQEKQGGGILINRYGYSQLYVSHGLSRYYSSFGDERAKRALIRHARRVRDFPPLDHDMESYLATIHTLVQAYQYTGQKDFLDTALKRAAYLRTDELPRPIDDTWTQWELFQALEDVSNLPGYPDGEGHPFFGERPIWSITNGLRVFGWTHGHNVPYLLYALED